MIGAGAQRRGCRAAARARGRRVYASDGGSDAAARSRREALAASGVDAVSGAHDLERIARARSCRQPRRPARTRRRSWRHERPACPIVSEIEVALRVLPGLRYIAITGTNGKTTTTALVGHLLRTLGRRVADAGNIGTPLTRARAPRRSPPDWVALELSSFQLHDTPSVDPDRRRADESLAEPSRPVRERRRVLRRQGAALPERERASTWVTNADDARVRGDDRERRRCALRVRIASESAEMRFDRERPAEQIRWMADGFSRATSCRCSAITTSRTRWPRRSR